ncbi:hypothetical protein BDP27DRAFT_1372614 [Rhodocollybia butyracea]|uniref:Uncharacterized protein n=1 Tax=Rhodocollybia butyracea TaxID=206335 RepID=A0A9P5P9Y7_9AGAR|nr:hypothetical protein BDP27DRAFT_1372614 [Rhodocollybia butyracea]
MWDNQHPIPKHWIFVRPSGLSQYKSRHDGSLGYNPGGRGARDGWNDISEVGGTNTRIVMWREEIVKEETNRKGTDKESYKWGDEVVKWYQLALPQLRTPLIWTPAVPALAGQSSLTPYVVAVLDHSGTSINGFRFTLPIRTL